MSNLMNKSLTNFDINVDTINMEDIFAPLFQAYLWKLHGLSKWHGINQRNTKNNGV